MRRILLRTSLFALLAASPASAGLVNGSFEPGPDLPASISGQPAAIPGWLASARGVEWLPAAADHAAAPNGDYVVRLVSAAGALGSVEQAFPTEPGQRYEVTFWFGSQGAASGSGRAAIRAEAAGTARVFAIDNPADELLWQAREFAFTATGSVTRISLRAAPRRGAGAAYVDAVVVRPAFMPHPSR